MNVVAWIGIIGTATFVTAMLTDSDTLIKITGILLFVGCAGGLLITLT